MKNIFKKDLTKLAEERCFPVAKEILKMIANYSNLKIGRFEQKELNKEYKELIQSIKELILEKNLYLEDINYIMKLIAQPNEIVKNILNDNINELLSQVQDKFWGKPINEVTLKDLDIQLKR